MTISQNALGLAIQVKGAEQALRALRTIDPQVAREVGRDITNIGADLAAAVALKAPAEPPVSGWQETSGARGSRGGAGWPAWGTVQATSRRRGMSVIVTTTSDPSAIASLAESLGRGTRWKTKAGLNLVTYARMRWSPIVQSGKKEGRVARATVAEKYPQIMEQIQAACDRAVVEVNRRMP